MKRPPWPWEQAAISAKRWVAWETHLLDDENARAARQSVKFDRLIEAMQRERLPDIPVTYEVDGPPPLEQIAKATRRADYVRVAELRD